MTQTHETSELTLTTLLDHVVAHRGDAKFFHVDAPLPYHGLDALDLSAPELRAFVNRFANTLLAAGIQRGDRVVIYKTSAPDYVFLALGAIKAGGIAVPVHHNMSVDDLAHYTKYVGASFLVTDETVFTHKIKSTDALPAVPTWVFPKAPAGFTARHVDLAVELPKASPELAARALAPETVAYLFHTSGTTGFPKAVVVSADRNILAYQALLGNPFPTNGNQVAYRDIPGRMGFGYPYHHLVSSLFLNAAMLGQMDLYTHVRTLEESRLLAWGTNADALLGMIQNHRINFFIAFPEPFHAMYEAGLARYDLTSCKAWACLSDTMHEVHLKAFAEAGGVNSVFCDLLAASEIGTIALTKPFAATTEQNTRRSMGFGNKAGMVMKIGDNTGKEVPPNTIGRFYAHGPTLLRGYWDAHDMYVRAMVDGWYCTGDIGYRDEEGRIYHLDRESDIIHTRGGPAYTLVIEEHLMNHPDVGDAAVCKVVHGSDGDVPFAVVYLRAGRTADAEAIRAWANQQLPAHSAIRALAIVEPKDIPRGMTGKVLKRVLRDRYANSLR